MTDLLVPVAIGAAAALLPFLAAWCWRRIADAPHGLRGSIADAVWRIRYEARVPPNPALVTPTSDRATIPVPGTGILRPSSLTGSLPRAVEPVAAAALVPAGADGPVAISSAAAAPGPLPSGLPAEPDEGQGSTLQSAGAAEDGAAGRGASPSTRRARSSRGRSTIQLDPLDAPVDTRRARIAVGGLIDDLAHAKLGRRP